MKTSRAGWVSLPIIVLIVSLGGMLLAQQWSINTQHQWQHYYDVTDERELWHLVWDQLQYAPSRLQTGACAEFCSPWDDTAVWQKMTIAEQEVWYQAQHIQQGTSKVQRWCASRNQLTLHCWWQRQGQIATAVLRH